MAIPTFIGSNKDKVSGTTLQVASVTSKANSLWLVGITYKSATVHPSSVKFGGREFKRVLGSLTTETNSSTSTVVYRAIIHNARTANIDITWPSAIDARVCAVVELEGYGPKDVQSTQANLATTDPGTGAAATTTIAETLHIAFFGSNGPVEDTVGTINLGHTNLGRDGTTGGLDATNETIHATYENLTATGDCRATKTGATQRRWANVIMAFSQNTYNDQGLVPGEFYKVEDKFEAVAKDFENAVFHYNESEDTWEVFDVDTSALTAVSNAKDGWDV